MDRHTAAEIMKVQADSARVYAREADVSEHRRVSAMAAFAAAAGRMQAMAISMLAELREMEHRHEDPRVLADLLHLDHLTAQTGRLADSVAVLSGARSGRRWAKPIAMESILRGAMGRVPGYQRVRLRAVATIAVAGHAAEGVMQVLAELLDNACRFSPPTTEVHVYAAEVPAGVVITIEDSGLVMSDSALRRAQQAVADGAGGDAGGLSSLTGTRLGLAVVGHLATKHHLTVTYRPSAIGGTAVLIVVPRDLTVELNRAPNSGAMLALPAAASNGLGVSADDPRGRHAVVGSSLTFEATETTERTETTLPRRRRGSTLAAVHPDGVPASSAETPAPPVSSPGALRAFQSSASAPRDPGARDGQDSVQTSHPENDR